MSVSAYKRTIRETQSPREIERQIFSRITAALAVHAKSFDEAESERAKLAFLAGGLQPALVENIKLWAALKTDLAHPNNALPDALRAQLISLALFVERETTSILRGQGRVENIVSINRSIIDGLAGLQPEAAV